MAVNLLFQSLVLGDYRSLLGGVLDRDQNPVQVQRLLDEVKRAFLDAFHGCVDVSMAGDHHNGRIYALGDHLVQHLGSVHSRHLDVTENHIVPFLVHHRKGGRAVLGHIHIVALVTQNLLKGIPDGPLVINNQYLHRNSSLFLPINRTSRFRGTHSSG